MQPGLSKTQPLATISDASGVSRALLKWPNSSAPGWSLALPGNLPLKWYELRIVLMLAFPLEPIKIAASARVRVITADCRTMFVDCAATLGRVQELARGIVDRVLAMAKNPAVTFNRFGEAFFRFFEA
jgi:hypothetical protein